ncbi:hypothetical protein CQJ30_04240 [Caldibacillus thermoamylovorans]|nr:hypothetical protein CQJ30_04240 [Caldibacillus thermoamylovorans]
MENKPKLSHRIVGTTLYGTKLSKIEASLSHKNQIKCKERKTVTKTGCQSKFCIEEWQAVPEKCSMSLSDRMPQLVIAMI